MKIAIFYATLKLHKPHKENSAPQCRLILSGSGTENLGIYVDHQIKEISTNYQFYTQDTPDFLRKVDKLNEGPKLQENAILVIMDAIGLYANIPQEDRTECIKESLNKRKDQTFLTEFNSKMIELMLKHNLFEFHSTTLRQLFGTAMGVHPAPNYANNYMAR